MDAWHMHWNSQSFFKFLQWLSAAVGELALLEWEDQGKKENAKTLKGAHVGTGTPLRHRGTKSSVFAPEKTSSL